MVKPSKKENIYNIPNPLSLSRIILSFPIVLLILYDVNLAWAIGIFVFAAFTDFLDGFIARKYNQVTNFGRNLDMIADRILMISVIIAIIIYLSNHNLLNLEKIILMLLIVTREIICWPFFIVALVLKKRMIPHARFFGKLMTVMQGITFPMIVIGWTIAIPMAILTSIVGIVNSGLYIYDSLVNPNNSFQLKMDKEYRNK